jgi:NAD(P)-dependent dehydrogenase (short-subunit alcohol dehydrogenase family)
VKNLQESFSGKTAVITGATGHLGSTLATSLSELGSHLVLIDIDTIKLKQLKSELTSAQGVEHVTFPCDFSDRENRMEVISRISQQLGPIDFLVNNAAFVGTSELEGWAVSFEDQSSAIWNSVIEVNLTSMFDFAQGLLTNLEMTDSPSIVNIASIHGYVGPDWSLYHGTDMSSPAAYSASKAGVINLTRWLAATLGPKVRVNSISPGGIARGQKESFVEKYVARVPLGRMASENDIVGPVLFLLGNQSRYITGQDLAVDGGYTAI